MKKLFSCLALSLSLLFVAPLQLVPAQAEPGQTVQKKININAASVKELQALPGIGPVTAQRIVDYRTAKGPFAAAADLLQVKGVGEVTLQKISALVVLQ